MRQGQASTKALIQTRVSKHSLGGAGGNGGRAECPDSQRLCTSERKGQTFSEAPENKGRLGGVELKIEQGLTGSMGQDRSRQKVSDLPGTSYRGTTFTKSNLNHGLQCA